MLFPKDKIYEQKQLQLDAMNPKMLELGFERLSKDNYYNSWHHYGSNVSVEIVPIKANKSFNNYIGFKMRIERRDHSENERGMTLVKIDNYKAVSQAIADSIEYVKRRDTSDAERKAFEAEALTRLGKLFPGKKIVIGSSRYGTTASITNADGGVTGSRITMTIYRDWTISEASVQCHGTTVDQAAKFLGGW
jgi:hypothetical protein